MAFGLYPGLDRLHRADLSGLNGLDLKFLSVKSICLDGQFRNDFNRFSFVGLDLVHIDGIFVDAAQSFVDVLELVFLSIKKCIVANQMEHDLGHAAGFAALCSSENNILHLAAAKRFCSLFAEHPRDRVGHI